MEWREWHRERAAPGVYCPRHVGHAVMYCDACKVLWSPCCGGTSPHPADINVVAHVREQIARDPEAYANPAKLRATAQRISDDLTGQSGHATVPTVPGE